MFGVWPDNWPSVTAFLELGTQIKPIVVSGGLIWTGYHYADVDVHLRRKGYPDAVYDDLRVMEAAAIAALNERRN
ncbi:DUF1799 domain-containing protein [Methylobrevis pamukkalensis]|uniref:DUF1799 domain-containing protein n=1 Tax=Methylobrevis pamukkalensis TaxID=1439726 RepID=UPI0014723DA0|nr:DUF1799 domain-containing protein [Methylobrevis pamukkalensis]